MNNSLKRYALVTIFIAIFTDILGFGMIIPLIPILARDFGADGLQVGFLISIYSITQFIVAPYFGRLSDHFGRKPLLLLGLFGMGLAHLWLAFSDSVMMLFLSRVVAGFFGANIVIGMAYIADVTHPKERSKNLGLIGVAFGLGFSLGPALGFLFILMGNQLGSLPPYGESFAACGASLICFINFLITYFLLKESSVIQAKTDLSPQLKSHESKTRILFSRPSFQMIWKALNQVRVGRILILSFILWVSIAQIEPVLILLVQDDFGWKKSMAYWSFAYIGFLMVFSQGFLVRKLIPRLGERVVNFWGLFLFMVGLFLQALSPFFQASQLNLFLLASGVTLFGVGYSLSSTSLSGALSLLSPKTKQGSIFGINQSLSSLARILGPLMGGWCYKYLSHESPFFLAGTMGLGALYLSYLMGKDFPDFKSYSKPLPEEDSFCSINHTQLKNLLDKKIQFFFFRVEKLEEELREYSQVWFNKSEFKTEEEIQIFIKDKPLNSPCVFLCKKGLISKEISSRLRKKGYINAYYVEQGLKGLKEN